ncbi:ECF transporter S component [Streptococcus tangpeifui]|uniref:ECF transporter S component n=1 Tax=Streptococcus tangpeifui TaxID=2709400 RepID=UPI0013ED4664|nr:ECF transporter S component [Streptococcus sp. ZJ1593]
MKNPKIKYITYTAMFAAIAGVLMSLEISVPFMPVFYKVDFSDVPTIIATFLLGPTSGLIIEVLKILIKLFTVGSNSMYIGEFANLISAIFFVYPLGLIFKKKGKTLKAAVLALLATIVIKTLSATAINLFVSLPLYAKAVGIDLESLAKSFGSVNPAVSNLTSFILLATVPFNIVKVSLNGAIAYLLYKRFIYKARKGDKNG